MSFVCLAYHRITAATAAQADPYTVRPAQFRAQMAALARAGYKGVPVAQAGQQPRAVALTFDDGDTEFFTTAWPILREHGFGATVFVVASAVGQRAEWPGAGGLRLMDWIQLNRLAEAGVEIGAHGWRHQPLDSLAPEAAADELSRAYSTLAEHLPWAPAGLAYPYGRGSESAAQAAAQAGFRWACTARGGTNTPATPPYQLRRTLVRGRVGALRFQLMLRTGYARLVEWRMDLLRLP